MSDAALIVEQVALDSVVLNPANARRHGRRSIEALKGVLARFGQRSNIVIDQKRVVRKGNGTVMAARELGWTHVSAHMADLTDGEMVAYELADNRTAELSEWDYEVVAGQLRGLQSSGAAIEEIGWEKYELEPLLAAEWHPPARDDSSTAPGAASDVPPGGRPLLLTVEQRGTIDRAIAAVREREKNADLPEGRVIELICGDYLAGPGI